MQPQRFLDFVDMNHRSSTEIVDHFIDAEFIIDEDRRVTMVRLVFMR